MYFNICATVGERAKTSEAKTASSSARSAWTFARAGVSPLVTRGVYHRCGRHQPCPPCVPDRPNFGRWLPQTGRKIALTRSALLISSGGGTHDESTLPPKRLFPG